ncbi:uncharacterized protein LOC118179410 [Stegodyphus dumicola]|uniref:uncharacterized protein LOC118179410 n=1 Tax=Stegodyphus dumicola TaxID=202533 RepID=UPI0015A83863|nr:uncharacterized protein LOC118179410 [Stegodyphus dumicola]
MDQINKNILHSASILDAILIIDEMVIDVWMKLKWHDQFYTHGALIEVVQSCIFEYIQAVLEKIKECNFYSKKHQFKISKKLCVVLCNAYALFEHIHIIKNKIEGVLKVAKTEYGFINVNPLVAVESQILSSIATVYLLILEQVSKKLRKLTNNFMKVKIGNTFHLDTTDELCSYAEYTLEVLYLNLKPELFYILLPHMWITVLENLKNGLKYKGFTALTMRKKTKFAITSQALNELQIIFHCDGHGLSHKQLQNKVYKDLQQSIRK